MQCYFCFRSEAGISKGQFNLNYREEDDEYLRGRNRTAWNRYVSELLPEDSRAQLIAKGRLALELTPYSPEELQAVKRAFAQRSGRGADEAPRVEMPDLNGIVDLSTIQTLPLG
jgi:hypothetical protein